jgi:hypothetical protein
VNRRFCNEAREIFFRRYSLDPKYSSSGFEEGRAFTLSFGARECDFFGIWKFPRYQHGVRNLAYDTMATLLMNSLAFESFPHFLDMLRCPLEIEIREQAVTHTFKAMDLATPKGHCLVLARNWTKYPRLRFGDKDIRQSTRTGRAYTYDVVMVLKEFL